MGSLLRALRLGVAQLLPLAPDLINWLAGTALPVLPPPWNVIVGIGLNVIGKALRDAKPGSKWEWSPV